MMRLTFSSPWSTGYASRPSVGLHPVRHCLRSAPSSTTTTLFSSSSSTPPSLTISDIRETSARLSWPPSPTPPPTSAYKVTYGLAANPLQSIRTVSRASVVLRGLRPGAAYDVRVRGVGRGGVDAGAVVGRFSTEGGGAAAGVRMAAGGLAEGEKQVVEEAPLTELSRLEIRVGRIVECERHPDADSLYVEKVDIGEEEPRTIVSGLVNFVPLEEMVGRSVLVLANLKPRAMRGVTSAGMLLCASNEDHTLVDPLSAPEGSPLGELVTFEGHRTAPIDPGNRASKAFDRIAADLNTNGEGIACYQDTPFSTAAGSCFSPKKLIGSVS